MDRVDSDPVRDQWEARRDLAQARFERAVEDAASADVETAEFRAAMHAVREARDELERVTATRPR